ncbi:Olfactory receptor 1496 [Microtus ochrogaster]|uniref:Olfactory receptor 1496 n=1 Tax=Microtus ochrogaster TaxID=79684 RepID=A0A8J6L9G8_MICOH|nr:Olfactory receptor 1496 [Microtus ochrogaster]
MSRNNQSVLSQFLLLGLPIPPEHQHLFYVLFLAMYLTTVLGNLIIIILILLDSHLHTPMYLFLSNLSFSDLCFSSVTMPKLLQNMQSQDLTIPYVDCLTQMYFLMAFGDMESLLLVSSAKGIHKVFSTCGSHLSVVSLFYGTIFGLYFSPSANNSTVKETTMAMMFTVVTPMLNPFIYSLRNRDIKQALIRVICNRKISL